VSGEDTGQTERRINPDYPNGQTLGQILQEQEDKNKTPPGLGSPCQVENPDLNARFQARYGQILEAQADQLTVAQRLTRRALRDTIKIPFTDDLGTFEVEIRVPMSGELDQLMALRAEINGAEEAGDALRIEVASLELFSHMAALTTDPSMDLAFFQSGAFLGSDFGQIIKEILLEEQDRVTKAGSFRKGGGRR
jgi:hypothetical protein